MRDAHFHSRCIVPASEQIDRMIGKGTHRDETNGTELASLVSSATSTRNITNNPMLEKLHNNDDDGNGNESDEESFHIRSIASTPNGGTVLVSSIRDVIANNKTIYWYSCITGILKPLSSENINSSVSTINLRFRIWVSYLHLGLIASTLIMITLGVMSLTTTTEERFTVLIVCRTFGTVLQNCLLYPAIIFLRKQIDLKRDDVNRLIYEEAFEYAIIIGTKVFALLVLLWMLFVFAQFSEYQRLGLSTSFQILIIFFELLIYSPSNFMLSGLLSFLVMEQRVSFHTMKAVQAKVEDKTLTDGIYLKAREYIDERDRVSPVNWLLSAAIFNTTFGIILVFFLSQFKTSSIESLVDVTFVLTSYGRQTIVLIVFLLEVAKVNEIADVMLHGLAKTRWKGLETKRLNLYVVMKECPMGSTILYYRPSKWELILQAGSSVVGIGFAIFWAVVFA